MLTDFFHPSKAFSIATNKNNTYADIQQYATTHNKTCVEMQQVHGNFFQFITKKPDLPKISQVDAVLTNNPKLLLTVRTADCLPILLYHPSRIVGGLHAGRKSTQQHLLTKVLTFLKEEKNISKDLSLWFGPAICEACYEIDRTTNTHFNLISENMAQAYSVFPQQNIQIIVNGDCTQCLSAEYHSYRVEKDDVKMNYFGISLK